MRLTREIESPNEFESDFHVYEPHRAGMPPVRPYVKEAWRRRGFAMEMSRATMRGALSTTVLGRLWNILNPLLLALVYYLLVVIFTGRTEGLPKEFFPHLVAGIFAFYFVSQSISGGAASVVGAGKMIMNTAFPRILLPLSAVRTAFARFLPTVAVYLALHAIVGLEWSTIQLLAIPWLGLILLFAMGVASLFATLQVYFRDTASFLPYVLRIWLYVSPVIFLPEQLLRAADDIPVIAAILQMNPLWGLLGGWGELLVRGEYPTTNMLVGAITWSIVAVVGGFILFVSREREFAVRL